MVPFRVESDPSGAVVFPCEHVSLGQVYPEEVSAVVLGELLEAARERTGAEVRKAVISVPAYFREAQREATIRAGKLAGLEVGPAGLLVLASRDRIGLLPDPLTADHPADQGARRRRTGLRLGPADG